MEQEGGCACGKTRYKLTAAPLIVHACHCRDCQKQTGSAFVLNLWIETAHVEADHSMPASVMLKGGSGKPHQVFFCKDCGTRLWSRYHAAPGETVLLRAGTLDHPEAAPPDVHIFTRSKLPWLELPQGARTFQAFYDIPKVWPSESLERWRRNVIGQG